MTEEQLPRRMADGEPMEVGRFYRGDGVYRAPFAKLTEEGKDRFLVECSWHPPDGGESTPPRTRRYSAEGLGCSPNDHVWEISAEQYSDAVGPGTPAQIEAQTAEKLPRQLAEHEPLEVGRFYTGTPERCMYWALLRREGDDLLTECAYRPLDGKDEPTTNRHLYDAATMTADAPDADRRLWEISAEEYRENVGHLPDVEVESENEAPSRRMLEAGEYMQVGRFYAAPHGYYRAPFAMNDTGRILVEDAYRPCDGERRPTTDVRSLQGRDLKIRARGDTWEEISPEEYREAVGHLPEAEPARPAVPPRCPSCEEPVHEPNFKIRMQNDGVALPELLRGTGWGSQGHGPVVFDGCLMCLERRLEGQPVVLWLLREWVRGRRR